MAALSYTKDKSLHQTIFTWTGATNGGTPDTFAPVKVDRRLYSATIQASGTFATGSVALHGSLDGTNYVALDDADGTTIALTAAGVASVRDPVVYLKPVLSSGGGTTDIDVVLLARFESL